jgi:hypothetical protein
MNGRVTPDGRGFTVDKSLAYTICVGILMGGMWLGSEVIGTKRAVAELTDGLRAQAEDRTAYRRETDLRIRSLETARAGNDERLSNALDLLERIDARLERIEERATP